MPSLSLTPNSLASLLESAVSARSSAAGRAVHALILKALPAPTPPFLSNHLVNMYSKLDRLHSAQLVLRLAPTRSVVTWTAFVAGAVQNGHFALALLGFANMRREGIQPNDFTFPCAFKASCLAPVFGHRKTASWVFDQMPERNIVTWNAYIFVIRSLMGGLIALSLRLLSFGAQVENPIGLRFVGFSMRARTFQICGWGNSCTGRFLRRSLFLLGFVIVMKFHGVPWWLLYEQNDEQEKACFVFLWARKEGIRANGFYGFQRFECLCCALAGLELGRSLHALAVKACIEKNVFVGSALVDMYGKCGSIEDCERAFDEMPERNLVTWNALLGGYAHQGHADMAFALFQEMTCEDNEVVPNYVTLVCVLSACSRAGEVKMGTEIFESMSGRYQIEPGVEHYACVVDMLARAGKVEDAYEFIRRMPIRPTVSVWGALLGACRVYGKPELGRVAAENLFELDPHDSGNHVLLSNTFAAAGRWEEANLVRKEMKDVGINKGAGCSWVSVKNEVHVFQAKDTSHERNSEIQTMLVKLKREMKAAGYVPDTKLALYDLEEEEKETEVWHHSEKIALAFGLIVIPPAKGACFNHVSRVSTDTKRLAQFYQEILGFEEIESPKLEFNVIWLKLAPSFFLHLIERDPKTKLPEGPWSASSAVADPKSLPRGHHICFSVSNFDSFVQTLKGDWFGEREREAYRS
ncbi:pentatricopeptide repeat (PPR) superfamily protein [Actinidia rufa]|uniref:Pentatricopeptide repeat (PPR) superfamily protein n=1 Tax=Actinidia rufa TaxID=165716 RepID=A0A7J0GDI7_9ERIC|nr:pentatricopeptide repeat (PPR) superfamily protein [Actinidia rufa]